MKKYKLTLHIDDETDLDHIIDAKNFDEANKIASFMVQTLNLRGYSVQMGKTK
jgi:hypothetical protein